MSQGPVTTTPQKADREPSTGKDEAVPEQSASASLQSALSGGMPLKPRQILQLQRTIGNRATLNLLNTTGSPKIQRRVATDAERAVWLSFFPHYLPQALLNHYMDDTGEDFHLTRQMMIDCNPDFNIRLARRFAPLMDELYESSGGGRALQGTGPGRCLTNGTLGGFTVNYNGMLTMDGYSQWTFVGQADFYDYWDFDPRAFGEDGRTIPAELRVRLANMALPGRPFHVRSEPMTVWQTRYDDRIQWGGSPPEYVIDPASELMGEGAADVETDRETD